MSAGPMGTARFVLERWIQKGVVHQLFAMAALVVLVAVAGGLAAFGATERFEGPGEAVWWAFLRLTDPGYLGDDEGAVLRSLSTLVTVLGYVIFMGSMIAIMTQWLAQTLRKLESGLTPIAMRDHVIVLGWTNRTPEIVLNLVDGRGRLERFLARHEVRRLRVVVLSEQVDAERRLALREHLGRLWNQSQVLLRSGSPLQPDHLRRLDLLRAAAVIVPGADFEHGGAETSDARVVKTLMTVNGLLRGAEDRPDVVAELFDPLKVPLARGAVDGSVEVVASDRVISRLISQSVRHRGLADVLCGVLSHRKGNSLYLRELPELAGEQPHLLHELFPRACVLGHVHEGPDGRTIDLDPGNGAVLEPGDSIVFLAECYDDCAPTGVRPAAPGATPPHPEPAPERERVQRVLALGWSHKIGALVVELDESGADRYELTVMSRVDVDERERGLRRVSWSEDRVHVRHVQGDYALESDLLAVDPTGFDTVVLLASDYEASSEAADARTILGYVLLRSLMHGGPDDPEVLVELLDPDNARLFEGRGDVYLVTPRVLSYLMAHCALRPDLNAVFDELFCAGGSEITLRSAADLGLAGSNATFPELQRIALERGLVALGVVQAGAKPELNPDRARSWSLGPEDQLVVLARQGD